MMAREIWKFPLQVTDYQEIQAPDPKLLHVGVQGDTPCLWAEVSPHFTEKTTIELCIYGTGHPLAIDRGEYLGTFLLKGGALVFHAYGQLAGFKEVDSPMESFPSKNFEYR